MPRTGQTGFNIGTLVTKDLVIAGDATVTTTPEHPRGAMLRAYDQKTGKEVGNVLMPSGQSGSPMTYMVGGKQYIIVAVSRRRLFRRVHRLHPAEQLRRRCGAWR